MSDRFISPSTGTGAVVAKRRSEDEKRCWLSCNDAVGIASGGRIMADPLLEKNENAEDCCVAIREAPVAVDNFGSDTHAGVAVAPNGVVVSVGKSKCDLPPIEWACCLVGSTRRLSVGCRSSPPVVLGCGDMANTLLLLSV
jgi:hypothetical protein